ncbi:hypothetical protein H4R35_005091 [Dimargaris xerosporica]|nr:hypothetical protein H4R35_005091 [Dimargaris xerosporica]
MAIFYPPHSPYGLWPLAALVCGTWGCILLVEYAVRHRLIAPLWGRVLCLSPLTKEMATQTVAPSPSPNAFTLPSLPSTPVRSATGVAHPVTAPIRRVTSLRSTVSLHTHEPPQMAPFRPPTPQSLLPSRNASSPHLPLEGTGDGLSVPASAQTPSICLGECLGEQTSQEDDAVLYVCTKCSRRNITNACTPPFTCRLAAQGNDLVDMEDLMTSFDGLGTEPLPSPGANGKTKGPKTGKALYYNLVKFQDERWKAGLDIDGRPKQRSRVTIETEAPVDESSSLAPEPQPDNHNDFWRSPSHQRIPSPPSSTRSDGSLPDFSSLASDVPADTRRRIKIQPVECLSVCDRANAIAFAAPSKYIYQFADIDHTDPGALHDIMQFAYDYIHSADGYTKTKHRPNRLRRNITARIPPMPGLVFQGTSS